MNWMGQIVCKMQMMNTLAAQFSVFIFIFDFKAQRISFEGSTTSRQQNISLSLLLSPGLKTTVSSFLLSNALLRKSMKLHWVNEGQQGIANRHSSDLLSCQCLHRAIVFKYSVSTQHGWSEHCEHLCHSKNSVSLSPALPNCLKKEFDSQMCVCLHSLN